MPVEDDKSISNEEIIWRRVPSTQLVNDEMRGIRPTSQAFQDSTADHHRSVMGPLGFTHEPGMSCDIASETTTHSMLENYPGQGIVRFSAQYAREQHNQKLLRVPLSDDLAHIEVIGKKTKGIKRAFARDCEWEVEPIV